MHFHSTGGVTCTESSRYSRWLVRSGQGRVKVIRRLVVEICELNKGSRIVSFFVSYEAKVSNLDLTTAVLVHHLLYQSLHTVESSV